MPATQRIYKIDVNEVLQQVALSTVVEDTERLKIVKGFCELYSIPLDKEKLALLIRDYREISDALKKANK